MTASIYYSPINNLIITVKPMDKPNIFYIEGYSGSFILNEDNLKISLSSGKYEIIGYL